MPAVPFWPETHPRWITPDFTGHGLVNLAPTLLSLAGVPYHGTMGPLAHDALPERYARDLDTVGVLLVDGFGRAQFDAAIEQGIAPTLARLAQGESGGHVSTLTSVFPASTVPALMSAASGVSPGLHGLLGWVTHIQELGGPTEIVRWGPASRPGSWPGLTKEGLRPLDLLEVETVHERLASAGMESLSVGPANHMGSPFNTMLYRGTADYLPYENEADLWIPVRDALARPAKGRLRLIHMYHHLVDHVAHVCGPTSEEHSRMVAQVDAIVARLIDTFANDGRSLLLVTADHGHVATDESYLVDLALHPGLLSELVVPPTGERRVLYLHAKPGRARAAVDYLQEHLAGRISPIPVDDLIARGAFGPCQPSPTARRRLGDVVLLPQGPHQLLCTGTNVRPTVSHFGDHGSFEPEEMLIPLIAVRV